MKSVSRKVVQLLKASYRLICANFGYTTCSREYNVTHYCLRQDEAIEWAQCYPDADVLDCWNHRYVYEWVRFE